EPSKEHSTPSKEHSTPSKEKENPKDDGPLVDAAVDPELAEWLTNATGQVHRLGVQIRDLYKRQNAADAGGDRELAGFSTKQIEGPRRQVAIVLGKAAPMPPPRFSTPPRDGDAKDKDHPPGIGASDKKSRSSLLLDHETTWVSKPRTVVPWPVERFVNNLIEA